MSLAVNQRRMMVTRHFSVTYRFQQRLEIIGDLHKFREAGVSEVDFGAPRNFALLLFSGDLSGFHFDANALANELVETIMGRRRGLGVIVLHSY